MRVTSDLYVSALLRRVFSQGGFGAVVQKGGESAGAIFIVMRDRMGEAVLYGPAPQTGYDEAKPDDRIFVEVLRTTDESEVEAKLAKERRFDPDLWVVELETEIAPADLLTLMKP
jgi:hypothetical protein